MTGKGEVVAGAYEWEITNYKQYQDYGKGQYVESPAFSIGSYSWILRLYPSGKTERDDLNDALSLIIQNGKVMASFSLTIFDSNGEVLIQTDDYPKREFSSKSFWTAPNIIRYIVHKVPQISETKFIILCKITLSNSNHYDAIIAHQSERLQQFKKFELSINNEEFSDVKFVVEDKHIYAHKIVLASSSDVFAAMFKHNMKESEENVVKIEDITYEVLYELVRFIYSGKVPRIKEMAKELLIAADKYQIAQLKSICEQQLCNELSINNAINYLSFSDTNAAAELKKMAISFIVMNIDKIIDLKEFDTFMNLDTAVVKDIFREFLSTHKRLPDASTPTSFFLSL